MPRSCSPCFMRSPAEMPYMFALESAIDEMAERCGIDPVEFRRINDTGLKPISGKPYTSRSLNQCFARASEVFGWWARDLRPGSMRDGEWMVGYGCATACRSSRTSPSSARVRLTRDGHVLVQIAAHDVGTGATTIMGQIAAETLGIPLAEIEVRMGDTRLPAGPPADGSKTTASAGPAVKSACDKVVTRFGATMPAVDAIEAAFDRLGIGSIEEYAERAPRNSPGMAPLYKGMFGGADPDPLMTMSFGAQFVEVRIHRRTREIRVPRMTGAFATGRIMNPRTARSQLMGGMIWGVSAALLEATEIDGRRALCQRQHRRVAVKQGSPQTFSTT